MKQIPATIIVPYDALFTRKQITRRRQDKFI